MVLKKWLADNEWTQKDLADAVGVKQPSVASWLRIGRVPARRVARVSAITGLAYGRLNADFKRAA